MNTHDQEDAEQPPEYPLSAPIKPDDPERRSDQSQADTRDWSQPDDEPAGSSAA